MNKPRTILLAGASLSLLAQSSFALIYSTGLGNTNPGAPDAAIPGFVGPAGDGVQTNGSNGNYVNPVFTGWATRVVDYSPHDLSEVENYFSGAFSHPERALGAVTGSNAHIVSLDDMNATELTNYWNDPVNNAGPGTLTLGFDSPIFNGPGADFAAFENGFINASTGDTFAELGYVEVSTNGTDFARFPSISLTAGPVGGYGSIDPANVYNLVGKHVNAYGQSWGTPFDLDDLASQTIVMSGVVDLNDINYVRIVDIPGDGSFTDSEGNPIYDAWHTFGSGGVDFEALGVINQVPVPEPAATPLLIGLAVTLLVLRRRR